MIDELAQFLGLSANSPYLIWIAGIFVCFVSILLFDLFRFVFFGHRG